MVKSRFLHQTLKTEGESVFDTEFTRQTHQKGLIPNDSCVQFGAQVAEEAEEPHLGYSGPRGWGVPCREGSGPRAGVPFQAGLRTQALPPGPPPEPWLAAAHRATNVPQRNEPSGSFKAAPNPRPRAQLPALPLPPLLSCGVAGTLRPVQGRPQQCRQHGVAAMPCLGSRVHREPHAHVSPMTPSTWLL